VLITGAEEDRFLDAAWRVAAKDRTTGWPIETHADRTRDRADESAVAAFT
jgi:hypothetical protein